MTANNCGLRIADYGLRCIATIQPFQFQIVTGRFHLKSVLRTGLSANSGRILKSAIESCSGCCLFAVFLVEALDAASGVNQFLLAREEWMASRADFNVNLFLG